MTTEEKNLAPILGCYNDYKILEREFAQQLGYSNRQEIPDSLVSKIARFCDAHPEDMMTPYYAFSLIKKFYRKRTKERWGRLFLSMDTHLQRKKLLLDIFFGYQTSGDEQSILSEICSASSIWRAIEDDKDGYGKANLITRFSSLFTEDIVILAYQRALAMPVTYRVRALAGICPRVDAIFKENIYSFLCGELIKGTSEAAIQLTRLFSNFDEKSQSELISIYLTQDKLPEQYVANFLIQDVACLRGEDAQRFVARVRGFRSTYLKNRCLLKLRDYLPVGEIDAMCQRFIESFPTRAPSSELIHNLYHFSAVLKNSDIDSVIDLALEKIGTFDDSKNEIYEHNKYYELTFITPHLKEEHMSKAIAIAESIRGGYKRNIISKLKRHFSNIGLPPSPLLVEKQSLA